MKPVLALVLSVWAALPLFSAEMVQQLVLANSPGYERAADPLRNAPPQEYEFSQAVLPDVMRLLAHDAGISFFSLPSDAEGADRLVTFSLAASPFQALETLAAANGVALIYDRGIWYMRPANDKELIGRTYQIKYNALEEVKGSGSGGGLGQSATGSVGGGSGSSGGSYGGGSGGGGGLDLQGSNSSFTVEPSQLIDDIKELLDLATTGFSATLAPLTSVDSGIQLGLPTAMPERGIVDPSGSGASASKVIWNSDSNTLYIVA
ncbi:MAG: hypothetical protein ACC661_00400, partial [Verrucomicrobiales bacterium]